MTRIDKVIEEATKVSEAQVMSQSFKYRDPQGQKKALALCVQQLNSGSKVFLHDKDINLPTEGVIVLYGKGITQQDAEREMKQAYGERRPEVIPIENIGQAQDSFPDA